MLHRRYFHKHGRSGQIYSGTNAQKCQTAWIISGGGFVRFVNLLLSPFEFDLECDASDTCCNVSEATNNVAVVIVTRQRNITVVITNSRDKVYAFKWHVATKLH